MRLPGEAGVEDTLECGAGIGGPLQRGTSKVPSAKGTSQRPGQAMMAKKMKKPCVKKKKKKKKPCVRACVCVCIHN